MERAKAQHSAFFLTLLALSLGQIMPFAQPRAQAADLAAAELGIRYHGGAAGKSFAGAMGVFTYFQSQKGKGVFRPNVGASVELITGKARVGSAEPSGIAYVGGVYPGIDMFFFKTEKIQPFVEIHGILSWVYANLPGLPTKADETSLGLAFGFQLGGGADIRYGKQGDKAFRIHTAYQAYQGKIAGVPGFQLNAFSLGFGFVF